MREECEATMRQTPSRRTHTRVKRKRPLHGWPLPSPDWMLVPVTTAVSP